MTFFDTGDSYGTGKLEGQAERLLGRFRREYRGTTEDNKVVFGTKLASYPWRLTGGAFEGALRASLERMGRGDGPMELMQLHWSTSNYAPWQEGALRDGLEVCYNKGVR